MNSALCLIYLLLCLIISNSGSVRQSVKYYVLNSISDDGKLDKPTPVTFLRFHLNHSADPWKVYKKPTWEPSGKHSLTNEENSMQREKDILNGKVLRVTSDMAAVFILETIKDLEKIRNFTTQYTINYPGFYNETSETWDGGIGLLQNDQADIAANLNPINAARRKVVDFLLTLMTGKICLLIKKPSKEEATFTRSGYLQPFAIKAWCGMLLLLFATMALLTFMKKKAEKELHCGRYMPKKFLQLWGILCQQGLSEFPRTSSYGIVYFSIFCFGLIVFTIYSSLLISDIVSNQDGMPFSTMEEFVQNKIYKLIAAKPAPFFSKIKQLEFYPYNILKKKLMKDEDLPNTFHEYRQMICRDQVAGFAIDLFITFDAKNYNCSLAYICTSKTPMNFAMSFQKNGPYTQALNYNLLKLKERGIMDNIYQRNFVLKKDEDPEVIYTGVTLSDISTLLSILLASFVLPLIVLFFEKVHFRFYEKETAVIPTAARRPAAARIRNKH